MNHQKTEAKENLTGPALCRERVRAALLRAGADAALITCTANMIYLTGRVVNGYLYLPREGAPRLFLKKPAGAAEAIEREAGFAPGTVEYLRKPEQIPELLSRPPAASAAGGTGEARTNGASASPPARLLIEDDQISYAEGLRLAKIFPHTVFVPGSVVLRQVRSVKTDCEIALHRVSCESIASVFSKIPALYRPGMRDTDLCRETEFELRRAGHLGLVRSYGRTLETPSSGSVLAGGNATAPGPYDFALGGAGADPTAPVGANGTPLTEGCCVLVDFGGNFSGRLADMSRTFSIGKPPLEAAEAHKTALAVQAMLVREAVPGAVCGELYERALALVKASRFSRFFMGCGQQSRFIAHGVGIELNELPVIAPGVETRLEAGMLLAAEPKFTLPGIGAVGTENTFLVTEADGLMCLTELTDEIISL